MRHLAALAVAAILVACTPQAPPSLRPYPPPVAQPLRIPIIPHCDYGGGAMDWTVTPPFGQVPFVAWYTVIDQVYGPHQAVQIVAGSTAVVASRVLPWQLFMLTSDTTWAPVSNIVANPPPVCV